MSTLYHKSKPKLFHSKTLRKKHPGEGVLYLPLTTHKLYANHEPS
jgi:hypothetical protein